MQVNEFCPGESVYLSDVDAVCKLPDRKVSPSLQLHHICHLLHGWCESYIYEP